MLTRPRAQSDAYAAELGAAFGDRIKPVISPLLEIRDLPFQDDLDDARMLLFSSANGVRAFSRQCQRRDIPCLCVGEKTTGIARKLGFQAQSAGGSAPDLVALAKRQLRTETGAFVHIRGQSTRGNIARTLDKSGMNARDLIVYTQEAMELSDEAKYILTNGQHVLLPLFSPRTAEVFHLQSEAFDLCGVTAICISDNVRLALPKERFCRVLVAPEPTAAAITREIAAAL